MSNQPKVSVVIPSYNADKFLHILLDSLLQQTNNNFEIIIIDDGSTDNTSQVANDYANSTCIPIKLIQQSNKGVSSARNAGLLAANGEFCIFIDSDDYVSPTFIEKLLMRQSETNADLVYCGFIRENPKSMAMLPTNFAEGNLLLQRIKREVLFHAGGVLIRRDILIKNEIFFDTQLRLGEDLLFMYMLLSKYSAFAVKEYLYHQTYRSDSVMNSTWAISHHEHNIMAMTVISEKIAPLIEAFPNNQKNEINKLLTRATISSKIKLIWFLLSTRQYHLALEKLNSISLTAKHDDLSILSRKDLKKYRIIHRRNVLLWQLYFLFRKKRSNI